MLCYFKFLLLSLISKISTWAITSIYIFITIFLVYILPCIINESLSDVYTYIGVLLLIVISIATCSSYIAATIFRSGIDDGTEILVLSKSLSRSSILFAKVLVLLIFLFSISIFCSILTIFSMFTKHGHSNPTPFVLGTFISYLVIGLFFSSLTILLSLKLKKANLTLLSASISTMVVVTTTIDYLVCKSPGIYNQINSYSIVQNSLFSKNNRKTELIDGYNLYFNYYPVTPETTNFNGDLIITQENKDNVIQDIYNGSLYKCGFINSAPFDIGFQWTELMSLNNFEYFSNSGWNYKNDPRHLFRTSSLFNFYLSFQQIDISSNKFITFKWRNDNSDSYNEIVPVNSRTGLQFASYFDNSGRYNLNDFSNQYYSLETNYVYLPIITKDKEEFVFVQFENPYLVNNWDIINYIIDANGLNLIPEYTKMLSFLKTNNLTTTYYFNQFLLSYFFNAYNYLLANLNNNQSIKIINKDNVVINTISSYKLVKILVDEFNIELDYYNMTPEMYFNSSYINSTKSLISFSTQNLEACQLSAINYLDNVDNVVGYINDSDQNKIISTIILKNDNNVDSCTNFYAINNKIINEENNKNFLQLSNILLNDLAVITMNINDFSTFASVVVKNYLNIYSTIFGWLITCMIFISISIYFYYKKDFK